MSFGRSLAVNLGALAALGCGGEDHGPAVLEMRLSGFDVHAERSPPRLRISSAGTVLLDVSGVEIGSGAATFEEAFGHFRIDETSRAVTAATAYDDLAIEGDKLRFTLRAQSKDLATAEITGVPGALTLAVRAAGDANRARLRFGCLANEHFIGMGGQSFDVDHRGQNVPLWVAEDGVGKVPFDEQTGLWQLVGRRHSSISPVPIYLSSRGYALLLSTHVRSIFDFCAADPNEVALEAWEGRLEVTVFPGSTPAEALSRLTQKVGRPKLPPAFAFAPWLDAIYGSANVRRVAAKARTARVPASVIWTEDWRGGKQDGDTYALAETWELDRGLYPDFEALAGELHAAGWKFLVYHNSFLLSTSATYAEALAGGHTIRDKSGGPYLFNGITFEPTSLLDLTSPAAREWARGKLTVGLLQGADGWMADFGEWLPPDAVLASGEDPLAYHDVYPVAWAELNQAVLEAQQAKDGVERLFFARSVYLGSQPKVGVIWAGDQQSDFSEGDGIPSIIPMGIGLGIAGFPYFGHDIAGYMHLFTEPTTRELWYRWVTLGALSPVMRTHHGRAPLVFWNWEKDAASTAHMARWARVHMKLHPYLYAMAQLAANEGMPMFRPLALAHPGFEAGWTSRDQFMLGDRIYVAPVITQGATERAVELPAGRYFPLLGGPAREGGAFTVAAPLEEIPAWVPAGAMLPMLTDDVDTVVGPVPVKDDREVWLWPGGASRLTEVGGMTWSWDAAELDGPITSATWNGAALTMPPGARIEVMGPGELVVNGGKGRLVTSGGAADRRVGVVFGALLSDPRGKP